MPPRGAVIFALAVLALLSCSTASAQPKNPPRKPPRGGIIDSLRRMSPAERQRALKQLPDDRRKQAEDRLNRLDQLPPEERKDLEDRFANFRNLPPDRQQKARAAFRRFSALDADRRPIVRDEYTALRALSPAERKDRMSQPEWKQRFSRQERAVIEDFLSVLK